VAAADMTAGESYVLSVSA